MMLTGEPKAFQQITRTPFVLVLVLVVVLGFCGGRGRFPEEFFMPHGGAAFDENSVSPWTRGDFRGVLNPGANPPRRFATAVAAVKASQAFTPSTEGIFRGAAHSKCYASIFFTTLPATSVRRNSRPICL